jgi:hypothetical protein
MSDNHHDPRPRATEHHRMTRIQRKATYVTVAMAAMAYVAANAIVSTRLWFWWDELTVLNEQSQSVKGLLLSHEGNWFPLGRLAFFVENKVFGNAYGWYAAINAILVVIIVALTVEQFRAVCLRMHGRVVRTLSFPAMVLVAYALAGGIIYDIQFAFQVAWFLSILSIVLGCWLIGRKGWSAWWYPAFIAVSFLFLASPTLPASILGVALIRLQRTNNGVERRVLRISWEFASITTGVALTGAGFLISSAFPPNDPYAAGEPIHPIFLLHHLGPIAATIFSTTTTWILTPVGIVTNSSDTASRHLGAWFEHHLWVCLIVAIALAVPIVRLGLRRRRGTTDDRTEVWMLLAAAVVFETMVTVRGYGGLDTSLARRYDPTFLLIVASLWAVLALRGTDGTFDRWLRRIVQCLVAATFAVSVISFPWMVQKASNSVRLRDVTAVNAALRNCVPSSEIPPLESIQPFYRDKVCDFYARLGR